MPSKVSSLSRDRKKAPVRSCTGRFRPRNSALSKRGKSRKKNLCRKLQRRKFRLIFPRVGSG
jgi:hypothetical protein